MGAQALARPLPEVRRAATALARMAEREDSPMAEMFTLFPHESAVVMQRGIELGIFCSCLLVMHCTTLVLEFWNSEGHPDRLLRAICLTRIFCALPRPYFWF